MGFTCQGPLQQLLVDYLLESKGAEPLARGLLNQFYTYDPLRIL